MELPKNITQIGEADRHCKIYVEDYVISYMKQLNQLAMDKDMAVALYGTRKEESGVSYLFLYGACKLTFLQKETRHLSQTQQQEIEKLRKRYFQEYSFLGYRLLNGEMLEGFHICEQDICRYISGYAQFYEKNDGMLAYMLDVREDAPTEVVDQEKYEIVRKRQEERRAQNMGREPRTAPKTAREEIHNEEKMRSSEKIPQSSPMRGMRTASIAVFAFLCLIGLSALSRNQGMEDLQVAAKQAMSQVMQQQLPDALDETGEPMDVDTLVAEEKLTEAVLQENELALVQPHDEDMQQVSAPGNSQIQEGSLNGAEQLPMEQAPVEPLPAESTPTEQAPVEQLPTETVQEAATPSPISYTIREGDTLIGISLRNYGTDQKVEAICTLNQIADPNDIKVGQTILLP